jgi:hypothetical protein
MVLTSVLEDFLDGSGTPWRIDYPIFRDRE